MDNEVFVRDLRSDSVSQNTLAKNMSFLTERIKEKVRTQLPNIFALIFDG